MDPQSTMLVTTPGAWLRESNMRTAPDPFACSTFSTSNSTANWTLAEVRHHENEEALSLADFDDEQ